LFFNRIKYLRGLKVSVKQTECKLSLGVKQYCLFLSADSSFTGIFMAVLGIITINILFITLLTVKDLLCLVFKCSKCISISSIGTVPWPRSNLALCLCKKSFQWCYIRYQYIHIQSLFTNFFQFY
jgi:hypothetical protein